MECMNQEDNFPQEEKPRRFRSSGAWWGLVLIFVGAILIAQRLGYVGEQFNWWAIFILIPAIGSLSTAFFAFQKSGRFNAAVRGSLGGGLVVLTVALMFMFGLDWTYWWPLMVIVPGFSMFLNGLHGPQEKLGKNVVGVAGLLSWLGLGVIYLGFGFLADNLNWLEVQSIITPYKWWAIAILIPAFGAFVNAVVVTIGVGRFNRAAVGLATFGLMALGVGVVALLGISWNLLTPILLILAGVGILLGIFSKN